MSLRLCPHHLHNHDVLDNVQLSHRIYIVTKPVSVYSNNNGSVTSSLSSRSSLSSTSSSSSTTTTTPTPTPVDDGTIQWIPCAVDLEPNLQCGTLSVPLDWINPSGQNISLPLVRVPAKSATPRNQTIIFNPGGPGVSGISQFVVGQGSRLQTLVGDDWDLVTFDPRGVALNMAYSCPDVNSTIIAETDDRLTEEDGDDLVPDNDFNVPVLDDPNGVVPSPTQPTYHTAGELIGTTFVARDIQAMAEAFGQDGYIRYWGFSYGTLLGATVAAMFPDQVDRVVLDGNINPTDYYYGLGDEAVSDYDAGLEKFLDFCAQAGPTQCPLAHDDLTGSELLDEQWSFYNDLLEEKVTAYTAEGDQLKYDDLQGLMKAVIFSGPSGWGEYLDMWAYGTITARPYRLPDVARPHRSTPITCGDANRFSDVSVAKFEEWRALYNDRSQYGGDTLTAILFACATWQVSAKEGPPSFEGIVTKTPILFVENFYDPVTPSESARNSSAGFVGSAIQWHNGFGHCSLRDPSKQVTQNVKSYFDTGVIPDVSTIAEPDSPAFPNLASSKARRMTQQDEQYEEAVAGIAAFMNKKPDSDFQYPEPLRHAQRNVYELLRWANSTSTPSFDTTSTASTTIPSTTSGLARPSTSAWASTITSSSWSIPAWCTPIAPFSSSTRISSWTATTTPASTRAAVDKPSSWLDWVNTTTTSAMNSLHSADLTFTEWATFTETTSVDPTWSDWAISTETASADPTWSDWATSTGTTSTDPTWSDWATSTETTSADPTWSDWATSTETTSADPTWSDWASSTKTGSADPTWSDWASSTETTSADPTWTDWNDPGESTTSRKQMTSPKSTATATATATISLKSVKPSTSSLVDPWQTYTGDGSRNSACAMSIGAVITLLTIFLGF
ncbi:TAP-like protein-domain-containing protein [Exophiala viscosa]|uniref:TAP-like protein-domain-containing protein n=1 Tax=Exophiala viscosa TaxID=2486360 RepID=A0AAN6DRE1_9EURO|nr:TAP-like protein-domain-containing protein [Exophiala viscosa]